MSGDSLNLGLKLRPKVVMPKLRFRERVAQDIRLSSMAYEKPTSKLYDGYDATSASEESPMGGLELITINRKNYQANPQFFGRVLTKVQEFIAESYKESDVLSRDEFASELKNPKNKNYTIDTVVDRSTKEVVAVVAHDVADVPRTPSTDELKPGQYQYTSIYYARAKGGGKYTTAKKYEPVLQMLIERIMGSGKKYSNSKGKINIGLITIDSRHKRVLHSLGQHYGGGYTPVDLGVSTLDDEIVGKDYEKNFEEHHKERPVVITNRRWTKSMLKRVMASDLDQSYNHRKPGQEGYRPLTNAQYFKDFAAEVDAMPGRNVTFRPI